MCSSNNHRDSGLAGTTDETKQKEKRKKVRVRECVSETERVSVCMRGSGRRREGGRGGVVFECASVRVLPRSFIYEPSHICLSIIATTKEKNVLVSTGGDQENVFAALMSSFFFLNSLLRPF